jgi:hypothetical protein
MTMTITLRDEGKRIYFTGNTFPAKDAIKNIGGKWDADAKAWWIGSAKRAEAVALVTESTMAQDRAAASLPALTGKLVPVPGNTYAARGALRDLGASWDAASKAWMVDASRLTLAQDAVAAAAKAAPPFRHTRCKQCGARPDERGWPRIYKNGVCSDCYQKDNDW